MCTFCLCGYPIIYRLVQAIDFRFVTQCLVHSNGIVNVFTYFIFNRSYRRGLLSVFLVFSAHTVSYEAGTKKWKHSLIGQESYAASHGTVNFGMDSDTKDVLTVVRSVESAELKVVENGNM